MSPFRRILVVVDPTREQQPALHRAAMLARHYRADLEIFATCYYSYLTDIAGDHDKTLQSFSEITLRDVNQRLEQLAESVRTPAVTISCHAEWHKSRHLSILKAAERFGADLVIKDTHYHTAINRALFTNTDWNLIRDCRAPLWLVKDGDELPDQPRIIAAVDLGEKRQIDRTMDENLLLTGKELARLLHGNLYAFHAFDLMPVLGDAATWAVKPERLPVEQIRTELHASHTEALDALASRHGIPSERRLLKDGSITSTLPGTATEIGAALVVIGAVSTGASKDAIIGSNAEGVLDHVPCDLLVLRPPEPG